MLLIVYFVGGETQHFLYVQRYMLGFVAEPNLQVVNIEM